MGFLNNGSVEKYNETCGDLRFQSITNHFNKYKKFCEQQGLQKVGYKEFKLTMCELENMMVGHMYNHGSQRVVFQSNNIFTGDF